MYSWPGGELRQTLDLGSTGLLPLEVIAEKFYSIVSYIRIWPMLLFVNLISVIFVIKILLFWTYFVSI